MSPKHHDEDCAGVWGHDPRNNLVQCTRCNASYRITPEIWKEVQDDLSFDYGLMLETKEGRLILEHDRKIRGESEEL